MENKLPKPFKRKWIKALKSGKYKQGIAALYNADNNSFCCLGVGAAIAGCNIKTLSGKSYIKRGYAIYGISKVPKVITGATGITEKLSNMNDTGKSFTEIANYIESNL